MQPLKQVLTQIQSSYISKKFYIVTVAILKLWSFVLHFICILWITFLYTYPLQVCACVCVFVCGEDSRQLKLEKQLYILPWPMCSLPAFSILPHLLYLFLFTFITIKTISTLTFTLWAVLGTGLWVVSLDSRHLNDFMKNNS